MCIFKSKKFELYTSVHLGYQRQDETGRSWRNRARLEQIIRREENLYRNALGQVPVCELAERKAAERKSDYQPAGRYQVAINPSPSPEPGDEHRQFWVVDASPIPYFVEPGVIVRGFDDKDEAKLYKNSL